MSTNNFMTAGDRRAEADRVAKARGPAYAEWYQAGLRRAMELITRGQREMNPYEGELLQLAIDAIGEEVEA